MTELIKAYECCFINEDCKDCPLCTLPACKEDLILDIYDYIGRLKSQNKEFDEKIVIQMGAIDWQAKEINRQKAEINMLIKKKESLQDEVCELQNEVGHWKRTAEYNAKKYAELIKEMVGDADE